MRMRAIAYGFVVAASLAGTAIAQQPQPQPQVIPPRAPAIADAKPDAQGVKRMAVFRGLDKITGRARDINAPVGVPVKFGTLTLTVQTCHTVPPEEPPETTAFVQIDEDEAGGKLKRLFSGWMFASTPALNALEHPTYDVWVINCKSDDPVAAATAAASAAAAAAANAKATAAMKPPPRPAVPASPPPAAEPPEPGPEDPAPP